MFKRVFRDNSRKVVKLDHSNTRRKATFVHVKESIMRRPSFYGETEMGQLIVHLQSLFVGHHRRALDEGPPTA